MKIIVRLTLLFILFSSDFVYGQKTENVFIITLDGLRWEELFGGADDSLITDTRFVKDTAMLKKEFWKGDAETRRKTLMPWMWNYVATNGVILGNRHYDNKVNVTNMMWFSYPGYNEILVGYSDPNINSNDKKNNPNITILEWLNQKEGLKGKVAAFGSWDVFPYIINEERSKIPVNAGFRKAEHGNLNERELFLNELQDQIPSPWNGVRLDGFTHHYAKEYIHQYKPRVVFISYGETDDFAHDSRYDHYLKAARNTDHLIQDLWQHCQSDEFLQGQNHIYHYRRSWQGRQSQKRMDIARKSNKRLQCHLDGGSGSRHPSPGGSKKQRPNLAKPGCSYSSQVVGLSI
jgi:hypothetical protein